MCLQTLQGISIVSDKVQAERVVSEALQEPFIAAGQKI